MLLAEGGVCFLPGFCISHSVSKAGFKFQIPLDTAVHVSKAWRKTDGSGLAAPRGPDMAAPHEGCTGKPCWRLLSCLLRPALLLAACCCHSSQIL